MDDVRLNGVRMVGNRRSACRVVWNESIEIPVGRGRSVGTPIGKWLLVICGNENSC